MMSKIMTGFGYALLMTAGLAWMDTLWIFGVEDSQKYTWWYLIYYLGN
jgi:hypothetical protein